MPFLTIAVTYTGLGSNKGLHSDRPATKLVRTASYNKLTINNKYINNTYIHTYIHTYIRTYTYTVHQTAVLQDGSACGTNLPSVAPTCGMHSCASGITASLKLWVDSP